MNDPHAGFEQLLAELRPKLHRYCARMTGSVIDGEDVLQEALAKAIEAFPRAGPVVHPEGWLFRIAHNAALDFLRRCARRDGIHADEDLDMIADPANEIDRRQAAAASLHTLMRLPVAQRSSVILMDVLGHSLEEISTVLDTTVPAVKAALHRGRETLRRTGEMAAPDAGGAGLTSSPAMSRYVALFNAHDWDGVREMLADDVRLDLVSRSRRSGRQEVGGYFRNYESIGGWHLAPAWLDGREVVAVFRSENESAPAYFIELSFRDGRLTSIKDFRYVPYIAADARLVLHHA